MNKVTEKLLTYGLPAAMLLQGCGGAAATIGGVKAKLNTTVSSLPADHKNRARGVHRASTKYAPKQWYGIGSNPYDKAPNLTKEGTQGGSVRGSRIYNLDGQKKVYGGATIAGTNTPPTAFVGAGTPAFGGNAGLEYSKPLAKGSNPSLRGTFSTGKGSCGQYCSMNEDQVRAALSANSIALKSASLPAEVRSLTEQRVRLLNQHHTVRGNLK